MRFGKRMRITNLKTIRNTFAAAALAVAAGVVSAPVLKAQNTGLGEDVFVSAVDKSINKKVEKAVITPSGCKEPSVLIAAPNPSIKILGKNKIATFVVDLSSNVLYHYDKEGNATAAYLIASGKKSTPTHKGIRIVTHVETYPYKSAPPASKRRKHPRDYGPKIIVLKALDPKTGEKTPTGEFIHGNRNQNSLGKYASKGCMRMDNEVIKELATQAKSGDIVIIK